MTIRNLYPNIEPTMLLDFANVRALDPRVTFTRASSAVVVDENKVYREVTSGTPRFDHSPVTGESLGLLIEQQSTNGIRNPRCEGAVVGTPGTLPTNWSTSINSGVTREIIGVFTENGVVFTRLRLTGTVSGAAETLALNIGPDTSTLSGYTPGVAATFSVFLRLHAGSFPVSTGLQRLVIEERSTTTVLAYRTGVIQPTGSLQRFSYSFTATTAGTTDARGSFWVYANVGASVDFTIDVGWPQLELVAFATSPILPPIGSPTQSTRAADSVIMSGSNFSSWYRQDEGTVYCETNLISILGNRVIWDIGPNSGFGTTIYAEQLNSTLAVRSGDAVLGVSTSIATTSLTNKHAFTIKQNDFNLSVNNSTVNSDTVGLIPVTATQLTLGRTVWSGNASILNGRIRKFAYYPLRLPNTELQALSR
jgi:hypothetical protein